MRTVNKTSAGWFAEALRHEELRDSYLEAGEPFQHHAKHEQNMMEFCANEGFRVKAIEAEAKG